MVSKIKHEGWLLETCVRDQGTPAEKWHAWFSDVERHVVGYATGATEEKAVSNAARDAKRFPSRTPDSNAAIVKSLRGLLRQQQKQKKVNFTTATTSPHKESPRMTNLTIRYHDRDTGQPVEIVAQADVVEIQIPAQPDESLPALAVNVNTDAVIIDRRRDDERVAMYQYTDIYTEAVADIGGADEDAEEFQAAQV